MTPTQNYAPGSHWHGYAGASAAPSLSGRPGIAMSILPHLAARLRHPRRSRFDAFMDGLGREAATGCPAPRPHALISAATRRSDEASCAALAARLWTPAEREAFRSLTAGGGVS